MEGAQFLLEAVLILLLGATLFHALRLERALGVLKRDRAVLEGLVAGFNESTRAAEAGIDRLRVATDGAGRQIARQIELAQRLRDDLGFLIERGETLAERMESGIRSARMLADQQAMAAPATMMTARAHGFQTTQPMNVPPQAHGDLPQHVAPQNRPMQSATVRGLTPQNLSPQNLAPERPAPQDLAPQDHALQHLALQHLAHQDLAPQHLAPQHLSPHGLTPQGLPFQGFPAQASPAQSLAPRAAAQQVPGHDAMAPVYAASEPPAGPRLRSEAERDLLRALRAAR